MEHSFITKAGVGEMGDAGFYLGKWVLTFGIGLNYFITFSNMTITYHRAQSIISHMEY